MSEETGTPTVKKVSQYQRLNMQIQKLEPREGDIVTVSLPSEINAEQVAEFTQGLSAELNKDVAVLVLYDGASIDVVSESELNELGYFRNAH